MATYATVSEFRTFTGKTLTTDDTEIGKLLDAAAEAINRYCKRPDGFVADAAASARVYTGSGGPIQRIDECVSVSTVGVKDAPSDTTYTTWAASTDYLAFGGDPERPDFQPTAKGKPYTGLLIAAGGSYSHFTSGTYSGRAGFKPTVNVSRGVPTVQVTARWGYAEQVPGDIKSACLMQAIRWYKRLQSAMADAVGNPEMGQLFYRRVLDPDIEQILRQGGYRRHVPG